ncbi:nuclear pore complex protein NUP98A isoform X2 [Diachasma alloeum]|uniref:nuclear pore complex protein NUP98A isoform X2 n=1 Tax=Diachasma alloeum TaxID=454923 RepID=UPI000738490A|nr:nuclear pore complex protein NUP98A isoform X2 [Diachasma alloeum]
MVVCKYFQQGNCRFGQYCRFEHGAFVGGQGAGNKSYGDSKSIVLGVAEEVLAAERGGQWLLSCFGPFKEQACIPGMEDVSPEEVRWEMYQAQKNGTVDQTKLEFQQLCQAMTTKREALKNPTHETADMLEKLQKLQRDSSFSTTSNFVLSTPQLGGGSLSGTGGFASKSFGSPSSASFGESVNSPPVTQTLIFTHPNNNNNNNNNTSFFGTAPTFGAFAAPQVSNSIFGGSTKTTSIFGNSQSMAAFGSTSSATSTPVAISQPNNQTLFSTNQQQKSIFPTSQSSSAFGGGSVFGGDTTNVIQQTGAPIFGNSSSTIFGQAKNSVAFGSSATIFGANGSGFGTANTGAVFGGQGMFTSSGSVFGQTTTSSPFGTSPRTTNSFATLTTSNHTPFTNTNNTIPFGSNNNNSSNLGDNSSLGKLEISASGDSAQLLTANSLANSQSGSSKASISVGFANTIEPPEKFGNRTSNPFISIPTAATVHNPFITKSQLSSESFAQSPFSGTTRDEIIDEGIYSTEENLSDNDRRIFLAGTFTLGEIAIRAPTIELR